MFFINIAPPQCYYSFCTSLTTLLFNVIVPLPFPRHCYFLSTLFFLDIIHIWHYCYFFSSSMLLVMFFFNASGPTIPWCYWSYSSTTFLLNVIVPPTPLWHYSCSYFRYFSTTPWCCCCSFPHCSCLSYFRSILSPLFHVFVGVGGTSFPNSTSSSQGWRWGFFFKMLVHSWNFFIIFFLG